MNWVNSHLLFLDLLVEWGRIIEQIILSVHVNQEVCGSSLMRLVLPWSLEVFLDKCHPNCGLSAECVLWGEMKWRKVQKVNKARGSSLRCGALTVAQQ